MVLAVFVLFIFVPPDVLVLSFITREVQLSLSLVDRPVEFFLPTTSSSSTVVGRGVR